MVKHDLVLFDLDGTLLDTSLGIFHSVRYAEKKMGFEAIGDKQLVQFIGPPPKMVYKKLYNISDEDALKATKYHREYGMGQAIYEAKVYDNIVEILKYIKSGKAKIGVTTLKTQNIAEKILDNVGIGRLFDVIIGMDESESLTKCDIIKLAINRTSTTGSVLMVGDSQYDYDGAMNAGIEFIGVLYGFGFERGKQYPFKTVESVKELLNYV